jgi:hypothetical protein
MILVSSVIVARGSDRARERVRDHMRRSGRRTKQLSHEKKVHLLFFLVVGEEISTLPLLSSTHIKDYFRD